MLVLLPQRLEHFFGTITQRLKRAESHSERWQLFSTLLLQPLQQVRYVIFFEHWIGNRGGARERLAATCGQLADKCPMRASFNEYEMPWRRRDTSTRSVPTDRLPSQSASSAAAAAASSVVRIGVRAPI